MKKNLIRTAVATAAIAGLGAGQSFADLKTRDYSAAVSPTAILVANEAVISAATGTDVRVAGALTFATGFSVGTSPRYARIDLSSGVWDGVQNAGAFVMGTDAANIIESVAAGGAVTDNYVIWEVAAPSADKAIAGSVTTGFTPVDGVNVKDKSAVNITYSLYETAGDAVGQSNALATDTGALFTFSEVTAVNSTTTEVAPPIDVTTSTKTGKVFAGGVSAGSAGGTSTGLLGVVNVVDTAAELLTNAAATSANLVSTSVLTVNGDFTWLQDLDTDNVPDGTYTLANAYLDDDNDCGGDSTLTGDEAETITDSNMTFTTTTYNADSFFVCVNGNGVTDIPVQTFTANYSTVGAAGYASESSDVTLFSHAKNGQSTPVNLVLNPTGAFKNFLRVSNLGSTSGDVSFTLTNDSGESVSNVKLGSIAGQTADALAGGNSTTMIDVADLYAAAQAALATFDVGTGKLRVTVTGNFGSMDVQNITTATDNTSFDTF